MPFNGLINITLYQEYLQQTKKKIIIKNIQQKKIPKQNLNSELVYYFGIMWRCCGVTNIFLLPILSTVGQHLINNGQEEFIII